MTRTTAVRLAVVTLGVTYFALWACAPIVSGPPPVPMADGRTNEFGLAPDLALNACGFGVSSTTATATGSTCVAWNLATYYRHQFGRFDLTAIAFGGRPVGFGAGVTASYRVVDLPRFTLAPELGGGFLWAHLALPASFALTDALWLYVEPSVNLRTYQMARVGTGLYWMGDTGVSLGVEVGVGYLVRTQADAAAIVGFAF
ncbi:MAG: hypothetical protein ABMB14_15910 [Myxococcota bacterium]